MSDDRIRFSFTWQAMQLLGKSLYSNAWSAVSELVANGLDAGATKVWVLFDICDKSSATIEIVDNGTGMDEEGLSTYAKVGYNRRLDASPNNPTSANEVMGRKGIGKLAALYLTSDYRIQTKHSGRTTSWRIARNSPASNDIPELVKIPDESCAVVTPTWHEAESGTALVMHNVNLGGLGNAAFDALSSKLANQFLVSSMPEKSIEIAVRSSPEDPIDFCSVTKNVAFFNLAYVASEFEGQVPPLDIEKIILEGNSVQLPLQPRKIDELISRKVATVALHQLQSKEYPIQGTFEVDLASIVNKDDLKHRPDVVMINDTKIGIPYRLTGWIGLHATIEQKIAQLNDQRFEKNQFYNPAQVRLYVRNKLASEELLGKLGITAAFANYIEGEISFDLLDDNLLPDIATSSRQGFDELDPRWLLLRSILRPIVRQLINERQNIAEELKRIVNQRKSSAKTTAYDTIRNELNTRSNLSEEEKDNIASNVISQFQGAIDLDAKEDYRVFLSHRSTDRLFTDFIYYFLLHKGAQESDFFYTSSNGADKYSCIQSLADQIKKNIVSDNTLIAYFTSPHFRESEYCLFEGGAGWATRSVDEYLLASTTYDGIPSYLTNGKQEMIIAPRGSIILDQETYTIFVNFINRIIDHLNKGRAIKREAPIDRLPTPCFPDKVEQRKANRELSDYMDPEFREFWDTYISEELDHYELKPGSANDPISS